MGRQKAHTPEEIVARLRQVEVLTGQGKSVAEAVRAIGVSEPTYYRWRADQIITDTTRCTVTLPSGMRWLAGPEPYPDFVTVI